MARIFKFYDDWKTAIFECPKCGWKGTFDQGAVEYYEALMDSSCPVCDFFSAPMLAIVSYPTLEERIANDDLCEWEKSLLLDPQKRALMTYPQPKRSGGLISQEPLRQEGRIQYFGS